MEREIDLIERIKKGETQLYEQIMRKYNQRLYRIARSMVKDEAEVEDILQETYIKAYQHLDQFENRAAFSTWLTRILINQANASLLKKKKMEPVSGKMSDELESVKPSPNMRPDQEIINKELKKFLEEAIDKLPEKLRAVYVMREVEGLNVSETAALLKLSEENVKTRLHRAKSVLKEEVFSQMGGGKELFSFMGHRCDRIVLAVMLQLGKQN